MDFVETISVAVGTLVLLALFLPISHRGRGYKPRRKLAPTIKR